MPRQREYEDQAARQAAYRQRKADRRKEATEGRTDEEVCRAARDLHALMEYESSQGSTLAVALVGLTPVETLKNISRHLMPR